ncbi:hypothetical protein KKC08_03330, partial [Patescibacteria group bacterium]|nr:hypothetical protein [Patescibacteria group bacterium]
MRLSKAFRKRIELGYMDLYTKLQTKETKVKQNTKKVDTKYIVAIIISLIIGASVLGYGFLNYQYKMNALNEKTRSEEQAIEQKKAEEEAIKQQYADCAKEAVKRAQDILKSRVELMESTGKTNNTEYKMWKEAIKKNLFDKDDKNEYYN